MQTAHLGDPALTVEDRECAPAHQHVACAGPGARRKPHILDARDTGDVQIVEEVVEEDAQTVKVAEREGEVIADKTILKLPFIHTP